MTDDDVELYLTLKYSNMGDIVVAFRKAIRQPPGYLIKHSNITNVQKGIHKWVEAGCPDEMEIAPEDAEFFLRIKFGTIRNAYYWWFNTPPGNDHGLNKIEENIVLDLPADEH